MKRIPLLWEAAAGIILTVVIANVVAASDESNGRAIVARALRAQGLIDGAEIRTLQAEGQYEGLDGFRGGFHRWATAPDRQRIDWDIGYLQDSRIYDGRSAWQRAPVPRELVGN